MAERIAEKYGYRNMGQVSPLRGQETSGSGVMVMCCSSTL